MLATLNCPVDTKHNPPSPLRARFTLEISKSEGLRKLCALIPCYSMGMKFLQLESKAVIKALSKHTGGNISRWVTATRGRPCHGSRVLSADILSSGVGGSCGSWSASRIHLLVMAFRQTQRQATKEAEDSSRSFCFGSAIFQPLTTTKFQSVNQPCETFNTAVAAFWNLCSQPDAPLS